MKLLSVSTDEKLRETGLKLVGKIPWGTHLCQFYSAKNDLLSILIPYFKSGLKNNEFCMWITSEALTADECSLAMKKAMPEFREYLKKGQIEIIDYKDWYLKDGKFDSQRVLNGWIDKLDKALIKGFEGLRLTGDTFWVEKKDWKAFSNYEKEVNDCIDKYRIIAVCTYALPRCGIFEILDVVSSHQFALIKHNGQWEKIEGSGNRETREKIKWLASFPELNPNPIVETDLTGKIYYINPAAEKLFPDLRSEGDKRPYLAGLGPLLSRLKSGKRNDLSREIEIDNLWYYQMLHYIKDTKRVRIYGLKITKVKIMEEELAKSEKKLLEALRAAKLGYYEHAVDSSSGQISEVFARLLGFKLKELPKYPEFAKWLAKRVHADDLREFKKLVHDFHTGKSPRFDYEFRVLAKNGTWRWLHFTSTSLRKDAQGLPSHAAGLVFDVTKRRNMEEALKESEERLVKTQEIAHIGSWEQNLGANRPYWSAETYRIYGYKPYEIIPSNEAFDSLVHPDDLKTVNDTYFDSVKKNKDGYSCIFRIIRKSNGEERVIYEKLEFIKNSSGKITGSTGMVQDITEQKQAEEALRDNEEKFRAVAETAKDAIISADFRGNIIYFNKGAEGIFGYSSDEVLNKPLIILMPEQFRSAHQQGFSRFLESNKSNVIGRTLEMLGKRRNGEEFPIELSLANWQAENETFFTAIIRDITERKNIDQRKDDFITIAGHELRTPVSAVKIMNQILQEQLAGNPQALKYLKKIDQQTAIQATLINDLLDVSKIQTGKLDIRKEQFDLLNLVKEAAETTQATTQNHKIIARNNICARIFADRNRITQVLTNFCSNAIKFSPNGGKIIIDLKTNKEKVVVSVTDHGIGIPKENHDRMFEKFYRVYGSGNKAYPGLGMGLYISYQIVKLHNGDMWFESKPKKGSTFYFSLPLKG